MSNAPIALFAYKRPEHTRRTLEALTQCRLADQSKLFVYCDGPKRPEDQALTDEVRAVAKSKQWCGEVEVIEQERNQGLAASVIRGVGDLCDKYGRVIVVEDDLVVAEQFLTYLNEGLNRYADVPRVMQISAHIFGSDLPIEDDALFLPLATSWGWATWKRAWQAFDPDAAAFDQLAVNRRLRNRFNLGGARDFFSMLERQKTGEIDSWAIRWYLSIFMSDGITLYPRISLVENIGFDGTGTHFTSAIEHQPEQQVNRSEPISRFPATIGVSPASRLVFDAIARMSRGSGSFALYRMAHLLGGDLGGAALSWLDDVRRLRRRMARQNAARRVTLY